DLVPCARDGVPAGWLLWFGQLELEAVVAQLCVGPSSRERRLLSAPPAAIADSSLPPGRLGAGRADTLGPTREPRRSMFLHASRRELDDPDQARLPDRVHGDLLFDLPASQGASLGEWL